MEVVNEVSRAIYQYVKLLNAPLFQNSNVWGFTVSPKGAVHFPTTIGDQITLFENIHQYYASFSPGTAPIEHLLTSKNWVMSTIYTKCEDAKGFKSDADQNFKDSKTQTQDMNANMAPSEIDVHKIAAFLQVLRKDNLRVAGDYGFKTSDAPGLEVDQLSSIDISSDLLIDHIVIDSIMTSMVDFDMQVQQGTTNNHPLETLKAFGELAMAKGHSRSLVINSNLLKDGIVKVRVKS